MKGKQVAFEEGTTSHILLNYALAQNGMTLDDIQKVPMPASDAGSALIAGKVPVAVTYEPYLTLAMQQNPKVKMLYSAGENPGLISDVFVVREDFLAEKPGQVLALLKAWDASVADYVKDTAGGRAIISEAVGAKPEELATAFDGVKYFTVAENKTQLTGDFVKKVVPEVKQAATSAGLLSADVDLAQADRHALRRGALNLMPGRRRCHRPPPASGSGRSVFTDRHRRVAAVHHHRRSGLPGAGPCLVGCDLGRLGDAAVPAATRQR